MQAGDAWGKEIFCIQQGNCKGSLDATVEHSIIQAGITGFEISMLERSVKIPFGLGRVFVVENQLNTVFLLGLVGVGS